MKDKLNFEARYPHPPEVVWKAMTDPESLSKWLAPNNFKPELGHLFQFADLEGKVKAKCEVVALKPGEYLSFTWDGGEDEPPSVVAWSVQPTDDGGTRVNVEHQVLEPAASYVLIQAGMNWRFLLGRSLRGALAMPIPIVYAPDDEVETDRVAGLTRPNHQFATVTPGGESKNDAK
jgi:uncharacterized protein YndB with AHSA1/START domain